jgi:hypothetical protein
MNHQIAKIGNPEIFDNNSESPDTSWGQKFRNTRLVFRKQDGKLEFHTHGGDHRPRAFISQIKRADKDVVFDDFGYVRLYTTDNNPGWAMVEFSPEPVLSQCYIDKAAGCYPDTFKMEQYHKDLICCPDFNFSTWLDFNHAEMYDNLMDLQLHENPIPKVCWRGAARIDSRKNLCVLTEKYPSHIDAHHVGGESQERRMSLFDTFKNYKYVIDTQAFGFSGRLKYLLLSGRLLFLQCHYHKCFFEKDLEPWVHYVPVAYDFSDIIDKIKWAQSNQQKCKQIIENALEFSRATFSISNINKTWKNLLNNEN